MAVRTDAELYRIARTFQRTLVVANARTSAIMLGHWQNVANALSVEAMSITRRISEAIAAGKIEAPGPQTLTTFSPAWRFQEQRIRALALHAQQEADRLAAIMTGEVTREKAIMIRQGLDMAEAQLSQVTATFSMPNREALEAFAGFTQAGTPLEALFESMAGPLAREVEQVISNGIAGGLSPAQVAKGMREVVAVPMARSQLIARTEMGRAFRESARVTYRQNSDLVTGWVWVCAFQPRTCAACWSNHGKVFPIEETLDDHPNGRCTSVPQIGDLPMELPNRDEAFAKLSEAEQRKVLGNQGFEALQSGKVTLDDFARVKVDPLWGNSVRPANLRDLGLVAPPKVATKLPASKPQPIMEAVTPSGPKTIGEASRRTRELFPDADVSWSRVDDVAVVNRINDQLADLVRAFPQLRTSIRRVASKQLSEDTVARAIKTSGGNFLEFNRKYIQNIRKWDATAQRSVSSRWWAPVDDIVGSVEMTATHEIGHHFHYLLMENPAALRELGEEIAKAAQVMGYGSFTAADARRLVSSYAATNGREMIAEAFAEGMLNSNARPVARAVRRIIEKYLGRR